MIRSLKLLNFRCFPQLSLDVPADGAVFVGANAQGKTSLLEAVGFLIRLHSARTNKMRQLVSFEKDGFGIAGEVCELERQVRFEKSALQMQMGGEEVSRRLDFLSAPGRIVWFGNADLDLLNGGGDPRRKYLDFVCSQLDPYYLGGLQRYRKALKSRNQLLRDRSYGKELQVYTDLLIQYGEVLVAIRKEVTELLRPHVIQAHSKISKAGEEVGFEYCPNSTDLKESFAQNSSREMKQCQTVVGPHRDDFKVLLNGASADDFASEGQQRSIVLSLKLAQGELLQAKQGTYPIYLLDDIFGELDVDRRNALMDSLPKEAQLLITTTQIDWASKEGRMNDLTRFKVEAGQVLLMESL